MKNHLKRHFIKITSLSSLLVWSLVVVSPVKAATVNTASPELDKWLNLAINVLSGAIGLVVVISIIVAGIQYMTAQGNASQVAAAKNRILMAIVALILFAFAYTFLQWVVPGGVF